MTVRRSYLQQASTRYQPEKLKARSFELFQIPVDVDGVAIVCCPVTPPRFGILVGELVCRKMTMFIAVITYCQ